MTLRIAVQMDHISTVQIAGDSTFALMLEAHARGHKLYHYEVDQLSMRDGRVFAQCQPVTVQDVEGDHYSLGVAKEENLADMDVILMRQDPPFHMGYITATHLLERLHPKTLVANNPAEVRNAPEKIFVTEFPDLMPETLITRSEDEVKKFATSLKTSSSNRSTEMVALACFAFKKVIKTCHRSWKCSTTRGQNHLSRNAI